MVKSETSTERLSSAASASTCACSAKRTFTDSRRGRQGDAYHSGGRGTSDNLQRALLAARRRERHHLREHAVLLKQRRHLLRGDLRRAAGLSAARNLQTKRS